MATDSKQDVILIICMDILFQIFIFFLTLSILIIVHEYGHYRVAKWCGVKVLRFSIGFGKPFFTWKVGKGDDRTEFALAPFLFGGYVRMLDSREKEVQDEEKGRDFNRKHLIKRALIVFAGPAANFILAIVFLAVMTLLGIQNYAAKMAQPVEGSILAQAGVRVGDEIIGMKFAGAQKMEQVPSFDEWFMMLNDAVSREKDVELQVRRLDGSVAYLNLPLGQLGAGASGRDLLEKVGVNGLWLPPRLLSVGAGGVAEKAGLQAGDLIKSINGIAIDDGWSFLKTVQNLSIESSSSFVIERDGQFLDVMLTPSQVEWPVVGVLQEGDPAYEAGLREGDIIKQVGSQIITSRAQYVQLPQAATPNETVEWVIERQGRAFKLSYTDTPVETTGLWRTKIDVGLSGFEKVTIRYGVLKSLAYGVDKTFFISHSILTSIGNMIAGKSKVQDNLSGPIEIANIASESAKRGLSEYIFLLAQISVSLAILNLLPLPVLDGGHLFLYMIEAVRRRPLSDQWTWVLQRIGVFLLLGLMLFVTFNDILRRL